MQEDMCEEGVSVLCWPPHLSWNHMAQNTGKKFVHLKWQIR